MEFGTGPKVSVPAGFEKVAAQFKGKGGSFEEGLKSIERWLERKGGDPKYAWVVFMKILKKGLKPRPFMIPAFFKQRPIFIKDLEDFLENEAHKF